MDSSTLQLTIELADLEMNDEELDRTVRLLKSDLDGMDEVESVNRVANSNVPEGSKSGGDFLNTLLNAQVTPANFIKVLQFLVKRLGNKPLKLKVKRSDGNEIEIVDNSAEDFKSLSEEAQKFLTGA
jgi:Effector Associated Constant Component 1